MISRIDHIERKDGIAYDRKVKVVMYDKKLTIRITQDEIDEFKEVCNEQGIKYNKCIRSLMKEYVKKNKKN